MTDDKSKKKGAIRTYYVLEKKLCELTGLTRKAIEHRRLRGHWQEGVHYQRCTDGRIWYNVPRID